jgi:hypothetical protein
VFVARARILAAATGKATAQIPGISQSSQPACPSATPKAASSNGKQAAGSAAGNHRDGSAAEAKNPSPRAAAEQSSNVRYSGPKLANPGRPPSRLSSARNTASTTTRGGNSTTAFASRNALADRRSWRRTDGSGKSCGNPHARPEKNPLNATHSSGGPASPPPTRNSTDSVTSAASSGPASRTAVRRRPRASTSASRAASTAHCRTARGFRPRAGCGRSARSSGYGSKGVAAGERESPFGAASGRAGERRDAGETGRFVWKNRKYRRDQATAGSPTPASRSHISSMPSAPKYSRADRGVPKNARCPPSASTATLSARSASAAWCAVSTTAVPPAARSRSSRSTSAAPAGSRPDVGSSRQTSPGPPSSPAAIAVRLRPAAVSSPTGTSARPARPAVSSASLTAATGMSRRAALYARARATGSDGGSTSAFGT